MSIFQIYKTFPGAEKIFCALRSPAGEELALQENVMVEVFVPGGIVRNLTMEEMDEYRRPFLNPGEDRRPTLTFTRQLPIEGEPTDVFEMVTAFSEGLAFFDSPMLFINDVPGKLSWMGRMYVPRWKVAGTTVLNGSQHIRLL